MSSIDREIVFRDYNHGFELTVASNNGEWVIVDTWEGEHLEEFGTDEAGGAGEGTGGLPSSEGI